MGLSVLSIPFSWHLGENAKAVPSTKWLCYGPFKEVQPWKSLWIPSKIDKKLTFKN